MHFEEPSGECYKFECLSQVFDYGNREWTKIIGEIYHLHLKSIHPPTHTHIHT